MKKLLFTLLCLSAWSSTPTYADGNQINLDLRKEISQKSILLSLIMSTRRMKHFCMMVLMPSMMISCNGCKNDAYGPEAVTYSVSLCFIDSTGKDLVAGLKDNPDSCKLYICPEGIKYPEIYKENFSFDLSTNGYWVMDNSFFKGMDEASDRFTYQIVSHYLFGDDETHLLTISWTIPDEMIHNRHFARCAHIKFDGSDVTDLSYEDTKFGEKTNYIKVILPQKSFQ